jgi:hypothetical protein
LAAHDRIEIDDPLDGWLEETEAHPLIEKYRLNLRLDLRSFRFSDAFRNDHLKMEADGKSDHTVEEEAQRLQRGVQNRDWTARHATPQMDGWLRDGSAEYVVSYRVE